MCSSIRRLSEGFTVYVQNKTVSIQMSVGKERSFLWDYNQLFSKTFQATKNISLLKRFKKKHTLPNTRPNKKPSCKLDRLDTWFWRFGWAKRHKGSLDIPKSTNQPLRFFAHNWHIQLAAKKNDTRKDSSHPSLTEETVELWDPYLCRNWEEAKIHNRHPQHLSNEKGVPSCLGIRVYESYKGMK